MRVTAIISILLLLATSCGKDKYTSAPSIKFLKFTTDRANSTVQMTDQPLVVFQLTDKEGDIGIKSGDSAKIFIKSVKYGKVDSLLYPDLGTATTSDLKVEISVGLFSVLGGMVPANTPYTDTLTFEIYCTDFAGHNSNTIVTPSFYYTYL